MWDGLPWLYPLVYFDTSVYVCHPSLHELAKGIFFEVMKSDSIAYCPALSPAQVLCLTHVKPSERVMMATSIGPPTVSSDDVMCRWSFVMEMRLSAIVAMSWTLKYATESYSPKMYSKAM